METQHDSAFSLNPGPEHSNEFHHKVRTNTSEGKMAVERQLFMKTIKYEKVLGNKDSQL